MLTSFTLADQGDRSADQMQLTVLRANLATQIERLTGSDGAYQTDLPGVTLGRCSSVQHPVHTLYQPAFCLMAQGTKRVRLCDETYVYDPTRYLVVSQNLPVCTQHMDATEDSPVLGMRIEFDTKDIASAALQMKPVAPPAGESQQRGMYTGELTPVLLDTVLRLVNLLHTPEDIPTLGPLYLRELLYRLLREPEGWRLAQMGVADSHGLRIAKAIHWLQANFAEPLTVEDLAREVHMSVSSLHSHFKAVTAMSPLQFQKQLRLQEARRIMLSERLDAGLAGHRVGYESPSQFNREYSRFFGAPPARDIKRLREEQLGV